MRCLIEAWLAIPPEALAVPPEKKNRRGRMPWGVWAYFPATARLTVEMWTWVSSAISSIRSGARPFTPRRRNSAWRPKIALEIRSSELWRCSTASMNQRAFSRRCWIHLRTASPREVWFRSFR